MRQLTGLFILLGLMLGGCISEVEPEPIEPIFDQALYDRGVTVYLNAYCGVCHALDAAESRGNFGPTLNFVANTALGRIAATNYSGAATSAEAYLRESILQPDVYFVQGYAASNHKMPAFTHLPAADIDAMVYMLVNQDQ